MKVPSAYSVAFWSGAAGAFVYSQGYPKFALALTWGLMAIGVRLQEAIIDAGAAVAASLMREIKEKEAAMERGAMNNERKGSIHSLAEVLDDCGIDLEYQGDGCYQCGGSGWIVTCIDDLCHGSGECVHGDGNTPCPNCNSDLMRSTSPE